ncbi:NAD(P)/FAD-dependent oxidoreductase [Polyangium fumosum]|uniref:NAD(P)/FAD-dependent oxidoreductase n=1 Tax=Polyangium fumosum TaxID=889272 RepID=A0A4U1JEJ2_9BACT|nr:NAD(P)/FAD-dependent oxidoreductase [Polyangium fumosum]TKD09230.1 NAD(P)/FAD-dependent oxidoreductase [Polyangium fumosum]
MQNAAPWDAIVIGGGPAGSSVATYLGREGRRVLLLERERFPREHIGESLLPGVLPYLDALGAREAVESAGFERKEGQTFVWGRDRTPWEIDFRELDVHPYAYFVDRGRFDEILLRNAEKAGATVREGYAVTRVIFEKGRAVGVRVRGPGGEERDERAKFVVDASGQSALVARNADLRRVVRGLKNVAVWAYWEDAERLPGHKRAHILTTSIPEGWIWVIPLGKRTSVGVVTSAATRAERDKLGAKAWYEQVLRASEAAWPLLANARRVTEVTGARDWSYRARRLSGPGILLAGDAACFIDPILSTGVHLAMTSGFWAAACVHSALDEPRHEPFLRRFYEETYGATYRELLTQVKAFYKAAGRRDSIFWMSKQILRVGEAVAPELAFLFITAGLLRNAAVDAPHDPAAQVRAELGERARLPAEEPKKTFSPEFPSARSRSRIVSPPIVWRVGEGGSAQLVSVRAEGLRLRLVRHEPRSITDRPRKSYFVLDLVDAGRLPLGLVLVEEGRAAGEPLAGVAPRRAGRLLVTLLPYPRSMGAALGQAERRPQTPMRPHDPAVLAKLEQTLVGLVAAADDPAKPLLLRRVRAQLRTALRAPGVLPAEITATPSRAFRGGGVAEPPMTLVFRAKHPENPVPRVYLLLEARLPPELVDIPILRTRFCDVWLRPERARDGRLLAEVPEVRSLVESACAAIWDATRPATTLPAAFAAAEAALRALTPAGYTFEISGRLGSTEDGELPPSATGATEGASIG